MGRSRFSISVVRHTTLTNIVMSCHSFGVMWDAEKLFSITMKKLSFLELRQGSNQQELTNS